MLPTWHRGESCISSISIFQAQSQKVIDDRFYHMVVWCNFWPHVWFSMLGLRTTTCPRHMLQELFVLPTVPDETTLTRVIDGQTSVKTFTKVIEGQPTITKITRVIETEPTLTRVVVEGEPSVTTLTRVIESQPSITQVTRVIEGEFPSCGSYLGRRSISQGFCCFQVLVMMQRGGY